VLLNASAALLAFAGPDAERPITEQLGEHLATADAAITSGSAARLLDEWAALTTAG
jgi:anthranilate phosphoribosyltransferase